MTFAEKLKIARQEAGLTLAAMSAATKIPQRTIEAWEIGDRVPAEYLQGYVLRDLESRKKDREN